MAKIKITEHQLQLLRDVFNDPETEAEINVSQEGFDYLVSCDGEIENKSNVEGIFKVVGKEAYKCLHKDANPSGVSAQATNRPGPTNPPAEGTKPQGSNPEHHKK
jgi:hypothetical protein